jgi:hypothetical protein
MAAWFLVSCSSESPAPPELDQAARSVEWSLTPRTLSQSTFPVVLPQGTPKQFVSWYFSTLGSAERPGYDTGDPSEREMAQAIGAPLIPMEVSIVHTRPDTARQKQIVMTWDDARRLVILEGYLDPRQPPVLRREIELHNVQSTNQLARMTAQSHLEMGGTYQAF